MGDAPKRVVVIGASSGLGRCIGVDRGQRGDRVALLARRHDRLLGAAEEAGAGTLAIACDVTDESACAAAIEEAAAGLAGIDALIYATGIGPLAPIERVDAATWRRAFDTNVVGAAVATRGRAAAPCGRERDCPLSVVRQRIADAALARPRRLRRQQGRTRQADRGIPRRASDRRFHARRRRRLRGWRG